MGQNGPSTRAFSDDLEQLEGHAANAPSAIIVKFEEIIFKVQKSSKKFRSTFNHKNVFGRHSAVFLPRDAMLARY